MTLIFKSQFLETSKESLRPKY